MIVSENTCPFIVPYPSKKALDSPAEIKAEPDCRSGFGYATKRWEVILPQSGLQQDFFSLLGFRRSRRFQPVSEVIGALDGVDDRSISAGHFIREAFRPPAPRFLAFLFGRFFDGRLFRRSL